MNAFVNQSYSVAIIGGGAVGYSCAIALAQEGHHTVILTGRETPQDAGRTAALLNGSLEFLYSLGIENAVMAQSWPLCTMRIIDVKGSMVRAPTAIFRATEIGKPEFGRNISNAKLVEILKEKAQKTPNLDVLDVKVKSTDFFDNDVQVFTEDGHVVTCSAVIAADGRKSPTREAVGIPTRRWSHEQCALTFHVRHTKDHEDISTEFHTNEGPFTLVPLGEYLSSVVWMVKPETAQRLKALTSEALAQAAERQCQSILGAFTLDGCVGEWPLSSLVAQRFYAPRLALIGEAAHAFPPIGAQGLNLGLRDAAVLAKLAVGADISSPDILKRYDSNRRLDVETRSLAVDVFNRSILSSFLPVNMARSVAFGAMNRINPLRKFMMKMGLGQAAL